MSFAAIGIGLTAVSVGTGVASAAGAFSPNLPAAPNLGSASQELSNANAALLPIQRGMSAAAQKGGKFTFSLPPGVDGSQYGFDKLPGGTNSTQTQVYVPGTLDLGSAAKQTGLTQQQLQTLSPTALAKLGVQQPQGQWVPYNAADFQSGGKYASAGQPQLRNVTNNNGQYTVDFTGYGTADTQGKIASQEAAGNLALAQKYDPQFIAQSLAQEQQADPTGTAARAQEAALIQQQMGENFVNPVSSTLEDQVDQQVNAGKGLDPMEQEALNQSLSASMAARGGSSPGANYTNPLTTGAAGIARQQAGQQKGIGELSSGTTPEDVQYRQTQQNMADLSALMTGQTPESEFRSLSSAGTGPTTSFSGSPLPTSQGGNLQAAASGALSQFGTQSNIANNTANPWLSGLTTAINGATSLGKAGVFG